MIPARDEGKETCLRRDGPGPSELVRVQDTCVFSVVQTWAWSSKEFHKTQNIIIIIIAVIIIRVTWSRKFGEQ